MEKKLPPPQIDGTLRKFALRVPEVIRKCNGIVLFVDLNVDRFIRWIGDEVTVFFFQGEFVH